MQVLGFGLALSLRPARNSYLRQPLPDSNETVAAGGPTPDRLLLIGTDAATGWGVRSHSVSLVGYLARAVHSRTGRGVEVEPRVIASGRLKGLCALDALHRANQYDAVIVVAGVSDAVRLRDIRQWGTDLVRLVASVRTGDTDKPTIFVAAIPAPSSLPRVRLRPGGLVDQWAERLNAESARVCAEKRNMVVIPQSLVRTPAAEDGRVRSSESYRVLARRYAEHIAPVLDDRLRPTDSDVAGK